MQSKSRMERTVITIDLANKLLQGNHNNRPIRPNKVAQYASLMKNGLWGESSQAVSIDTNGRVSNGQHRLKAIILSGVPCECWILWDAPPESYVNEDQNIPRSYADALGRPAKLVEVARLAYKICLSQEIQPPVQLTDRMAEIFEESHTGLMQACRAVVPVYTSAPVRLAACVSHSVMGTVVSDMVFTRYKNLTIPKNTILLANDPALLLFYEYVKSSGIQPRSPETRLTLFARGLAAFTDNPRERKSDLLEATAKDTLELLIHAHDSSLIPDMRKVAGLPTLKASIKRVSARRLKAYRHQHTQG